MKKSGKRVMLPSLPPLETVHAPLSAHSLSTSRTTRLLLSPFALTVEWLCFHLSEVLGRCTSGSRASFVQSQHECADGRVNEPRQGCCKYSFLLEIAPAGGELEALRR